MIVYEDEDDLSTDAARWVNAHPFETMRDMIHKQMN